MKLSKLIIPLATIASLSLFTVPALAAREPIEATITPSAEQVIVGDSFTITVAFRAASWNIHLSATGPVEGCTIDESDTTADAQAADQSFTANCTATGTGAIVVTLSGDASIDYEGTVYTDTQSGSVTVTAVDENTTSDPTDPTNPTDPTTGDDTGGENSGTTTNNGDGTTLPQTYDSIGRSVAVVSTLSAILLGVYLYNRRQRG